MILWLDQRNAECRTKLPLSARAIFRLIGKTDTINFNRGGRFPTGSSKTSPLNWAKVDKYINVSTYFIYLLTGRTERFFQQPSWPLSDRFPSPSLVCPSG
jgi:sugar (pentulose or hexulose) kinase